jgi:predicted enzyme related to lactoylglutathione lyase
MHFEILGEDLDSLRKFYSGVFGWKFERAPIPNEYWLIQTTLFKDDNEIDKTDISGGLTKAYSSTRGIINYISVKSLDESSQKIKEFGGRILTQKKEVFDMGWYILAEDNEGNKFAVWQDIECARAEKALNDVI